MNIFQLTQKVNEAKLMPAGPERTKEKQKLQKEFDVIFRKTMQPIAGLINQLQQAERTQNLDRVKGIGQKIEQINDEGRAILLVSQAINRL